MLNENFAAYLSMFFRSLPPNELFVSFLEKLKMLPYNGKKTNRNDGVEESIKLVEQINNFHWR
jgi:hypothetical protein